MTSLDHARRLLDQPPAPVMPGQAAMWQDDALCAQVGTDLFFPQKGRSGQDAKEVCYRCPVRRECLTDAMREEHGTSHERRFGIRGGLGARERIALEKGAAA